MGRTAHNLPGGAKLWTRGGFDEVSVEKDGVKIDIPEGLLWTLAAAGIQAQRISTLEQASAADILGVTGTALARRIEAYTG